MTKKFNKASLAMAVAGALAASSAQAVQFGTDGLGDAFVAPYYTVRSGYDTYINITNTSDEAVIFKIRFREHYNSRDARDFNVVLSPYDVWTAVVTATPATDGSRGTGARLVIADPDEDSCTVPVSIMNAGYIDFVNWDYTGARADGGPTSLDRTMEGYIEIFNMGQIPSTDTQPQAAAVFTNSLHTPSGGDPKSCDAVQNTLVGLPDPATYLWEPENVLKVNVALVNVEGGMGITYEPVTFANFYSPAGVDGVAGAGFNIYAPADDDLPNFAQAEPDTAVFFDDNVTIPVTTNWVDGTADAVSALLQRSTVINQYAAVSGVVDTDWVLTFPTKHHYVVPVTTATMADEPFPWDFLAQSDPTVSGACFEVNYSFCDREEDCGIVTEVLPSPLPPEAVSSSLCREVNVVQFGDGVLGGFGPSSVASNLADLGFQRGWATIDLTEDNGMPNIMTDTAGQTLIGLPVASIAVQQLANSNTSIPGNDAIQYGLAWSASYERVISGL